MSQNLVRAIARYALDEDTLTVLALHVIAERHGAPITTMQVIQAIRELQDHDVEYNPAAFDELLAGVRVDELEEA